MIFHIIIPADIEWLIRLVRDLHALIVRAYPEHEIMTAEFGIIKDDDNATPVDYKVG